MLNQLMTKRASQALKTVHSNKEVTKEILGLFKRIKDENVKQLVTQANTVDIHRTQGEIRMIDTVIALLENPEVYDKLFEKE